MKFPHRHSCYFWELWGSLCSWCSVGFVNDISHKVIFFEGKHERMMQRARHNVTMSPPCTKMPKLAHATPSTRGMEPSTPNICMPNVSLCAYLCSSCMSRHELGSKSKVSESISEQCTLFTCKRRNDPPESKQARFVCALFSVGMPSASVVPNLG